MESIATVNSYLGTSQFDIDLVDGIEFADFNTADLKNAKSWSWKVN